MIAHILLTSMINEYYLGVRMPEVLQILVFSSQQHWDSLTPRFPCQFYLCQRQLLIHDVGRGSIQMFYNKSGSARTELTSSRNANNKDEATGQRGLCQ